MSQRHWICTRSVPEPQSWSGINCQVLIRPDLANLINDKSCPRPIYQMPHVFSSMLISLMPYNWGKCYWHGSEWNIHNTPIESFPPESSADLFIPPVLNEPMAMEAGTSLLIECVPLQSGSSTAAPPPIESPRNPSLDWTMSICQPKWTLLLLKPVIKGQVPLITACINAHMFSAEWSQTFFGKWHLIC